MATARWLKTCIENEGFRCGPVNYIFCSPEEHLNINKQYLGHDYYTDVITFDYSDTKVKKYVSGDIFIDPRTVNDNAEQFGTDATDEMHRVLVHGVLHLCGYGDKTEEEQKVMRAKENEYLEKFKNN